MPRRKYHQNTSPERPAVLDSDDDDDSVFLASDDGTTNSFNGRSRSLALSYGDRVGNTAQGFSYTEQHADEEDESLADDEIMNPYIMNPFSSTTGSLYDREALLPPSVELPSISDTAAMQRSRGSNFASFDPFATTPTVKMQQLNPSRGMDDPLMEMEEEIDFFSDTPIANNKSGAGRSNEFSSAFSPFPKTKPPMRTNVEHGERAPLSGAARAYSHAYSGENPYTKRERGFLSVWSGIKSFFQSISHAASSMQSTNIPYGSRVRHTPLRLKLSHFRLFIITMLSLFAIGTITLVKHVLYVEDSMNLQYNEGYGRPNSLVLKKMEKAKKRWRRKNGQESKVEVYKQGQQQVLAADSEVYSNVQQQANPAGNTQQQQTTEQQVFDSAMQILSNATHQVLENVQVPVIVKTEEDGSLLIKLPPPKMGKEQPLIAEKTQTATSGIDQTVSVQDFALTTKQTDDDTVYIKLPYPEKSHGRALSDEYKEEVDPPLRGASIPAHDHPNLKRRPPKPLDLQATSKHHDHKHEQTTHHGHFSVHAHKEHHPGVLDALRDEFGSWMKKHGKKYGTAEEKERRFEVWKRNHFRISDKNKKHGPCRMTGKAVFGHNIFSDLEPEEFQDKFLTGYPTPEAAEPLGVTRRYKKSGHMEPPDDVSIHLSIQRELEEHISDQEDIPANGIDLDDYRSKFYQYKKKYNIDCAWYDVSCILRWIFGYQYIGGTREPIYDDSTYPDALDWRNMGVVSSVHAQGSCGACWAITAVETIESAYAIATGNLLDLAEDEVIACDGSCEMCNGGWPQNAYKYVMKHGGLPVKNSDYDGDFLYYLTATLAGESETVSESDMYSYFAETCPAGVREGGGEGGGASGSGSRDNKGEGSNNYQSARYGNIKGYGYATERCICYTDGTGCDCDEQDEKKAVLNIASYGPAAVCLEASLWQSYEGGIMTSETGCGSAFLDMNHCVQVVGYAFTTSSGNGGSGDHGDRDLNSGSRDHGGSRDGGKREGYWIVKNQWSKYWGMNGYAYLAMGDNTCGILNDMTQVYM